MRFNAHAKGGIKNLKGTTELELNFSARRPIHGRLADVGAETVQSPADTPQPAGDLRPQKKRNPAAGATLFSLITRGAIMTNRRRSATIRSVPAQTPEQLLELAQEYIRPLIGVIDRFNEAEAEDELRVISKQLTRLSFRAQPLPSDK
jgi:hypothetical protein